MFFRVWFYVCKVGVVLFILLFGSMFAQGWIPEAGLLARAIPFILVPICLMGACLGVAIFGFGMRMKIARHAGG